MAGIEQLLARLARPEATPAGELRRTLAVSAATLSRLIASAGDQVLRLGKGRAVHYARARHVESLGRSTPVFGVDEQGAPQQAGRLVFLWQGATWLEDAGDDHGRWFRGLPPTVADMAPQGYLGHGFSARFPELHLPARLRDWTDDDRVRALALRGEDTIGNLIIGSESLARFLAWSPEDAAPASFVVLAQRSALDVAGSSAGGEHPKFGTLSRGRHVLVKFAPAGDAPSAQRRRDLLWCEARALRLIAAAGHAEAVKANLHDVEGWRFLETERFDRVGTRGRRAVLTLEAIANEYLGDRQSWTGAAARLQEPHKLEDRPFRLSGAEASRLRWLDAFGQLTGNTDRHFGNITFFVSDDGELRLAPAYDTLPMILAPAADTVVERRFTPEPPLAAALDEWKSAAPWAARYWHDLAAQPRLDDSVRRQANTAATAVERLGRLVMPAEWERAYHAVRRRGPREH